MQQEFRILARGDGPRIAYRAQPGPDGQAGTDARPGLVFMGGYMSDMTGTKAGFLGEFAKSAGLPYLRFDYSGHGASEGAFEDGTIGSWLADSLTVIDELTEGPQILIGSSMGGWIALLAALARPERVKGLIGLAAAPDFTEDLVQRELTEEQYATMMRDGLVRVASAYDDTPYTFTRALVEDGRDHLLLSGEIALSCPVRLLQGQADTDVPWQTALRIAEGIGHDDVTVTLIKDGDHRLSRHRDLDRLASAVMELADGQRAAEAETNS